MAGRQHERFLVPPEYVNLVMSFSWAGLSKDKSVDMDANCFIFNALGGFMEAVHFGNSVSKDQAITHGGDAIGHVLPGERDSCEDIFVSIPKLDKKTFAVVAVMTCYSGDLQYLRNVRLTVSSVKSHAGISVRIPIMAFELNQWDLSDMGKATAVVLGRLVKRPDEEGWMVDPLCDEVQANTLEPMVPLAQRQLRDLVPDIVIQGEELLATQVSDVVKLLSAKNIKRLRSKFSHSEGCSVHAFITLLMTELCLSNPKLRSFKQGKSLISALQDMATQIDVYGQGVITWSAFTSFCVECSNARTAAGASSVALTSQVEAGGNNGQSAHATGKGAHQGGQGNAITAAITCAADRENTYALSVVHFKSQHCRTIARLLYWPQHDLLVGLEDFSGAAKVWKRSTMEPHQVVPADSLKCFPGNSFTEARKLSVSAAAHRVLDAVFIPERLMFVLTSSDQVLTLWLHSRRGASKLLVKIQCVILHTRLGWLSEARLLATAGADHRVHLWDLDQHCVVAKLPGHTAAITGLHTVVKPDGEELIITSSADGTVRYWCPQARACTVTLSDATTAAGVKLFTVHEGVLLMASYSGKIGVWDMHLKERYCMCRGEGAPVVFLHCLSYTDTHHGQQLRGITAEEDGVFKVWNIAKGDCPTGEAHLLLRVNVAHLCACECGEGMLLGRVAGVVAVHDATGKKDAVWPDLYLSTNTISLAVLRSRHIVPPKKAATAIVYNPSYGTFLTAEEHELKMRDLSSSEGRDTVTFDEEVTALALEPPLHRRIFVGTEKGGVYVVGYLNGEKLGYCRPHKQAIISIIICAETGQVITFGKDALVIVHEDKGRATGGSSSKGPAMASLTPLTPLRTLHVPSYTHIDAIAYTPQLSIIALAGQGSGGISMWGFENLHPRETLGGANVDTEAVIAEGLTTALAFIKQTCLLVSGHVDGMMLVWKVVVGQVSFHTVSAPLMRLSCPSQPVERIVALTHDHLHTPNELDPEDVIVASDANGYVALYPVTRVLQLLRRKCGMTDEDIRRGGGGQHMRRREAMSHSVHRDGDDSGMGRVLHRAMDIPSVYPLSPVLASVFRGGGGGGSSDGGGEDRETASQDVDQRPGTADEGFSSNQDIERADLAMRHAQRSPFTGNDGHTSTVPLSANEHPTPWVQTNRSPASANQTHSRKASANRSPPHSANGRRRSPNRRARGVCVDDLPSLPPRDAWRAHDEAVTTHCCCTYRYPVLLTAGVDHSIRLWSASEFKFLDMSFVTGEQMGIVVLHDLEAERLRRAGRWTFPGQDSCADIRDQDEVPQSLVNLLTRRWSGTARQSIMEPRRKSSLCSLQDFAKRTRTPHNAKRKKRGSKVKVFGQSLLRPPERPPLRRATDGTQAVNDTGGAVAESTDNTITPVCGKRAHMRAQPLTTHARVRRLSLATLVQGPQCEWQGETTARRKARRELREGRAMLRSSHPARCVRSGKVLYGNMYKEDHRGDINKDHRDRELSEAIERARPAHVELPALPSLTPVAR